MLIRPQSNSLANIKVIGVGGGGGNAVNNMIANYDIDGVEFIAVNTDAQALAQSNAEVKIRIGEDITRGLGSGGNPSIGRKAAEESVDVLHEHLAGSDMVFITAGMGGGTGTGASPVIAGISKNLGALTVAIVTKPFSFEGRKRMASALKGIEDLREKVDTLIVVPNQKLLDVIDKNISFLDAMKQVDDVLSHAVRSIAHLITQPGLINVDFADVKSIMEGAGTALMGMGLAKGEGRAQKAAQIAVSSPLLEISIDGAKGVLFNVIGGADMSMYEIDEAAQYIAKHVDPEAEIIFGATIDPEKKDGEIEITILATGFSASNENKILTNTVDTVRTFGTSIPISSAQSSSQPSEGIVSAEDLDKHDERDSRQNDDYSEDVDDDKKRLEKGIFSAFTKKKNSSPQRSTSSYTEENEEDLETPSFLRRKKY